MTVIKTTTQINNQAVSIMRKRPESHLLWKIIYAVLAKMTYEGKLTSDEQTRIDGNVTARHVYSCNRH